MYQSNFSSHFIPPTTQVSFIPSIVQLQVQLQGDETFVLWKPPNVHHLFCNWEDALLQGKGWILTFISQILLFVVFLILLTFEPGQQDLRCKNYESDRQGQFWRSWRWWNGLLPSSQIRFIRLFETYFFRWHTCYKVQPWPVMTNSKKRWRFVDRLDIKIQSTDICL